MAKNTVADLSTTAASNTDVIGQSTQGSALVSTIDTMIQTELALLARWYGDTGALGTVGGTANAITLTSVSSAAGAGYQSLSNGLQIAFKASAINTTAVTLNLDGLGVKKVRRQGDTALAAGDIKANGRYQVIYDTAYDAAAGAWVLMDPGQMTGDSGSGGTTGLVPAPASGDAAASKFLKADGVWTAVVTNSMTLLGTLTTTSGATQSLTGIAAGYRQLYCELDAVSGTGTDTLNVALSSTNGSAYGTAGTMSSALTAATVVSGWVTIGNISSTVALAKPVSILLTTNNKTPNLAVLGTDTAAVVNAIRFSFSGADTFDAGTIRIYGVK